MQKNEEAPQNLGSFEGQSLEVIQNTQANNTLDSFDCQGFKADFSYMEYMKDPDPLAYQADDVEYWKGRHKQEEHSKEWEKITPLDDVGDLPSIEPQLVPSTLGAYALSCASHYQTAFEMPLFCALSCLATAVQDKFQIEIKQGYIEPLNLYTIITAEPSELKSPTLKRLKAPLEDWEQEKHSEEKETIQSLTSENKTLEKMIEAKRGKASKSKDRQEFIQHQEEIKDLETGLQEVPPYTRLFADDVTPESLGTILALQKGRLTIAEAEGGFFGTLAGRYSRGVPNLDLILKAYNGENVRIDRKGQAPIFIKEPRLTLLFLIQPYLLKNRDNSEAFKGRGLDARFLYLIPTSKVGYRDFESEPINIQAEAHYNNMIKHFLNMSLIDDKPYTLKMTAESYKVYVDFMNTLELGMREGGELENMRDWAGKKGTLARLIGLFHCASHTEPQKEFIQLSTVQNTCHIMTSLIIHAKRAYGYMFDNAELQTAKKALAWINSTGSKTFTARDCFNGIRGAIKTQEEVNQGLSILEENAYIRKLTQEIKRGRPSTKYEVNPQYWGSV